VPTFTPRPTSVPTNTPIPAANLSMPGVPVNPIPDVYHYSDKLDKSKAHLYSYQAHQRQVLAYFDDEGILDASQEKAIADWCFEVWTRAWEIFGGYAYTTFECVMSNRYRGASAGVTLGNSVILDPAFLKTMFRSMFSIELRLNYQDLYKPLIAHEVFHLWNYGHMLLRTPWFYEGGANYYSAYLSGYPNRLVNIFGYAKEYARLKEAGSDRILSSITGAEPAGIGYIKGAVVFYMLDLEISERTQGQKSMDNVVRRLYSQQWQIAAPRAATPTSRMTPAPFSIDLFRDAIIAEAGNADFFNAFFQDYVDGARDLREWHNGLLKLESANLVLPIPPHPAIK
jgi:predicted metalloprotease with PDZ domain